MPIVFTSRSTHPHSGKAFATPRGPLTEMKIDYSENYSLYNQLVEHITTVSTFVGSFVAKLSTTKK